MAQLVVASLVILYGASLLLISLVDAAMYGLSTLTILRVTAAIILLIVAGKVFEARRWAGAALAAILLVGATWSFLTRHETRFPEEPAGGRAALLVVMSLAFVKVREQRNKLLDTPQNNEMQLHPVVSQP